MCFTPFVSVIMLFQISLIDNRNISNQLSYIPDINYYALILYIAIKIGLFYLICYVVSVKMLV